MRPSYTPEQEQLRQELRDVLRRADDAGAPGRAGHADGDYGDGRRVQGRSSGSSARDGWLAIGWPQEYGGQDAVHARAADLHRRGCDRRGAGAVPHHQHRRPDDHAVRHAGAEGAFSCPGSRPASCTSPSATRSRGPAPTWPRCAPARCATATSYVINGQKMWTSLIQYADYVWLACRTDPDAPRHKGLSIIIVPTDAAGFSWTPVHTMAGRDDQRHLLRRRPGAGRRPGRRGEQGLAADHQPAQPRARRADLGRPAPVRAGASHRVGAATKLADGRRVIDQEWVQLNLARVHAKAEFLKLMNWRIAAEAEPGLGPAAASATKVFGTEFADRGVPADDGGARRRTPSAHRLARRRAGRPDRADAAVRADPDLRRRHQRGAARHHRCRGARPARCTADERGRTAAMDFTLTRPARPRRPDREHPDRPVHAGAAARGRGRRARFDGRCGPSWPRPACCPPPAGGSSAGRPRPAGAVHGAGRNRPRGRAGAVPGLDRARRVGAGHVRTAEQQDRWAGPAGARRADHSPPRWPKRTRRPGAPAATAATPTGGGWLLTGRKTAVLAGAIADLLLVPAMTGRARAVFLVTPDDAGCHHHAAAGHRRRRHRAGRAGRCAGAGQDRVLGGGRRAGDHRWLVARATVGLCALQLGVAERALELTAAYARSREQFGKPIGSFQAVSQRLADALYRRRGHPAHAVAGGLAHGRGPAGARPSWRPPSSGRPRPGTGSRIRPSTCTAASASTPTARCTATSSPPSTTSSRSAARPRSCGGSERAWRPAER